MKLTSLKELCHTTPITLVRGREGSEVRGITDDSRRIRTGDMFYARAGATRDGHAHIAEAIDKGAAAVCITRKDVHVEPGIPVVLCTDCAATRTALAENIYGAPACHLIGVTGTNGKTTTVYMTRHFLAHVGMRVGLISTVAYEYDERSVPATRTTPDVFELYARIADMARAGMTHVVMEVSSHALALERIGALTFTAAVFTNLTQDHLDFHGEMEAYFAAKSILFTRVYSEGARSVQWPAIINVDDAWGKRLVTQCNEKGIAVRTYGMTSTDTLGVRARDSVVTRDGCTFTWCEEEQEIARISAPFFGRHNISNCLAAISVATQCGCRTEDIVSAAATMPAVPGRMEILPDTKGRVIVVDYAHTDDAVMHVLSCVREITENAVWVVIGCGGDRDTQKRPKMGAAAEKGADYVVLTSDNPRTEDPATIIEQIQSGMKGAPACVNADRKEAIRYALTHAVAGDTIVVAGKGHETYQEIHHVYHPFDDRAVIRTLLVNDE